MTNVQFQNLAMILNENVTDISLQAMSTKLIYSLTMPERLKL